MLETLMKAFDRLVPNSLQSDVKEHYRAFEYFRNKISGDGLFNQIDIETNTDCNRACRICPRHIEPRPKALMDEALYETLLGQLADINFRGRFSPVFYNEPTLDKRLPVMLQKAKAKLPEITIMIYTNGSLLDEKTIAELVDSGVDIMIVSQYIQNLARDDISKGIEQLPARLKKRVRYRFFDDDSPLSNRGGIVNVKNPIIKKKCYQASTDIILDYSGNVVLCANDYYTKHVFGNIRDRHIIDIWNDKEYKSVRKELRKGTFKYEMCRACAGV